MMRRGAELRTLCDKLRGLEFEESTAHLQLLQRIEPDPRQRIVETEHTEFEALVDESMTMYEVTKLREQRRERRASESLSVADGRSTHSSERRTPTRRMRQGSAQLESSKLLAELRQQLFEVSSISPMVTPMSKTRVAQTDDPQENDKEKGGSAENGRSAADSKIKKQRKKGRRSQISQRRALLGHISMNDSGAHSVLEEDEATPIEHELRHRAWHLAMNKSLGAAERTEAQEELLKMMADLRRQQAVEAAKLEAVAKKAAEARAREQQKQEAEQSENEGDIPSDQCREEEKKNVANDLVASALQAAMNRSQVIREERERRRGVLIPEMRECLSETAGMCRKLRLEMNELLQFDSAPMIQRVVRGHLGRREGQRRRRKREFETAADMAGDIASDDELLVQVVLHRASERGAGEEDLAGYYDCLIQLVSTLQRFGRLVGARNIRRRVEAEVEGRRTVGETAAAEQEKKLLDVLNTEELEAEEIAYGLREPPASGTTNTAEEDNNAKEEPTDTDLPVDSQDDPEKSPTETHEERATIHVEGKEEPANADSQDDFERSPTEPHEENATVEVKEEATTGDSGHTGGPTKDSSTLSEEEESDPSATQQPEE